MSKKILQSIVVFLGILIFFAFIALIYGMYLKISTSSEKLSYKTNVFSIELPENEKIKNIEVIDKDKLLVIIESSDSNYIGLSFVIKNLLIIIVTISYLYFYFFLGKAVKSIESLKDNIKKDNESNRVDSLDYFLNEEEINKKN